MASIAGIASTMCIVAIIGVILKHATDLGYNWRFRQALAYFFGATAIALVLQMIFCCASVMTLLCALVWGWMAFEEFRRL